MDVLQLSACRRSHQCRRPAPLTPATPPCLPPPPFPFPPHSPPLHPAPPPKPTHGTPHARHATMDRSTPLFPPPSPPSLHRATSSTLPFRQPHHTLAANTGCAVTAPSPATPRPSCPPTRLHDRPPRRPWVPSCGPWPRSCRPESRTNPSTRPSPRPAPAPTQPPPRALALPASRAAPEAAAALRRRRPPRGGRPTTTARRRSRRRRRPGTPSSTLTACPCTRPPSSAFTSGAWVRAGGGAVWVCDGGRLGPGRVCRCPLPTRGWAVRKGPGKSRAQSWV